MDISTYRLPVVKKENVSGEPRSERDEMLDKFLARLNHSRVAAGFTKLTPSRVAGLLKGMDTCDMLVLYKECDQAQSFGGLFWFKVKGRKH